MGQVVFLLLAFRLFDHAALVGFFGAGNDREGKSGGIDPSFCLKPATSDRNPLSVASLPLFNQIQQENVNLVSSTSIGKLHFVPMAHLIYWDLPPPPRPSPGKENCLDGCLGRHYLRSRQLLRAAVQAQSREKGPFRYWCNSIVSLLERIILLLHRATPNARTSFAAVRDRRLLCS